MTEDKQEILPAVHDETLPAKIENRVLILGSVLSGAYELGKELQEYLKKKDIPQPRVEVLRDAELIEKAMLGRETVDNGRKNPNLPKGVVLLPEMRQYTPFGMDLDTYEGSGVAEYVENLCQKYGIPLIKIKKYESSDQIDNGLRSLLAPQTDKD